MGSPSSFTREIYLKAFFHVCLPVEIPTPFIITVTEPFSPLDSSSSTSFLILKAIVQLQVSQVVITQFKAICYDLGAPLFWCLTESRSEIVTSEEARPRITGLHQESRVISPISPQEISVKSTIPSSFPLSNTKQRSLPRSSLGQTLSVTASHLTVILCRTDADWSLMGLVSLHQQRSSGLWFMRDHYTVALAALQKSCQRVWTNSPDNFKGFCGLDWGMCLFKCNMSSIPEGPVWISWTYLAL